MSSSPTDSEIAQLKSLLQGDEGIRALRFLRSVYYGTSDYAIEPALLVKLYEAELIAGIRTHPTLTRLGYLVGNVAKEYCNWLDNDRQVPQPKPTPDDLLDKDVLDLGCSYGRWLWYFQDHARSVLGVEQQPTYLRLGEILAELSGYPMPPMTVGNIDELSSLVGQRHYDLVFSRLVFNHVRVRDTLSQVARILRPGGKLWLQVERVGFVCGRFRQRPSVRWLVDSGFATFGILNSILFDTTGTQLRLLRRGRLHGYHQPVYPSLRAWKRELRRAGFSDFEVMDAGPINYAFSAVYQPTA